MRRRGTGSMWAGANRLRRRCGFDRNELRRDVDRRQRSIALGLLVFFMGVATPVAVQTAQAAHDRGVRSEWYEAATRHQVTATVVEPGSQSLTARRGTGVTWTEPDGSRHTGVTVVWRGKPEKGESQRIWINDSGRPTIRPRERTQTIIDGWAAALGTSAGAAVPFLVVYMLFRRRYDRRRYRDWDTAWARLDTRSAS